jgi:myosin heavy subunit
MFQLLAGILHLGNVDFEVDEHENSQVSPSSKTSLKHAMNLLQCTVLDIKLTSRVVKAKGRR